MENKKLHNVLLIALLTVGILLLAALVLNLIQGGVWVVEGLNGQDGQNGLDGQDGKDGQNGQDGQNGKDGPAGKSAYELAVEDGFQGTLHEWLLSLAVQGGSGPAGETGSDGVGVSNVYLSTDGHLMVLLSDGRLLDAGSVGTTGGVSEEVDDMGFTEVYEIVVKTGSADSALNLRKTPDVENGEIYTTVKGGDELLRIGIQKDDPDGYSRFLQGGVICYAKSKYFETKYQYEGELPEINLPDTMILVANEQTRFITDEILQDLPADLSVYYSYSGAGDKIVNGQEAFAITPTATGSATLTLTIQKADKDGLHTVLSKSVSITVVAANTNLNVKGLIIGDSRISDGTIVKTLAADLSGLTLLGTRQTGGSTVVSHEGRGAWSTEHYLNSASVEVASTNLTNPFYNPATQAFDFAYYMQNQGYTGLNFVVFNLGANDNYSKTAAENLDTMIASVKAYSGDIKVLVMTEYRSPADNYYFAGQSYNVASLRTKQFLYNTYLKEQFGGRESEGIYLLPNYLSINSFSDFQTGNVTTENGTEEKVTDVIHLGGNGYRKEAATVKAYLYWLFGTQ